jgi:hypothetical protein
MRVLKLADIAILNVTPLTSAVEVDLKRSNVQYKSNKEEEGAAYIGLAPEDDRTKRKLQDDMSMSMAGNDTADTPPADPPADPPTDPAPIDDITTTTATTTTTLTTTPAPEDPNALTADLQFCLGALFRAQFVLAEGAEC